MADKIKLEKKPKTGKRSKASKPDSAPLRVGESEIVSTHYDKIAAACGGKTNLEKKLGA
jgi:hypothetical protein